ncbi:protein of unknown function [Xenorhabdus poinarii G6]|uniref:Uncharacterized protein n=1 Tax=Xenorhabdus poinarii G6 TaxID=1354304 RepID=A0A068R9E3_9GAMM|nr:protein of unknown function [Xenorhabdus poinarii G6]
MIYLPFLVITDIGQNSQRFPALIIEIGKNDNFISIMKIIDTSLSGIDSVHPTRYF